MHHRLTTLLAACLLLLVAGCGDTDKPASKADRTKAALQQLFTAVRTGDGAAVAGRVVYRGADKDRKWKALCDYTQDEDKARVDSLVKRIAAWIGEADVEFLEFRSESESEGEWLVWKVKGAGATAFYACLDIGGTIALGDVDKD